MEFFFPSILPAVLSSLVSYQAEMISAENTEILFSSWWDFKS